MQQRPRVGEILVEAGVIDEQQLAAALGEQSRWGRRLGMTLIKLGMVEEGHLIRALARQLDLPVAALAGKRIANDVIALVPARVASEHGVIPLFVKQDGPVPQLFLGMEDPSNLAVLDDLSFRTGMEIHPVMVGPTELGDAIDRYYLIEGASQGATGASAGDDTMGEQSLQVVADEPPPAQGASDAAVPVTEAEPSAAPRTDDGSPTEASEAVGLPRAALDDIARALEETDRTRLVTRALTQLLIEKGVLSLEEIQARVAQQKGSESS